MFVLLPSTNDYAVYPSILPCKKETALTIIPRAWSFFFFEGEEYTVKITSVFGDEEDYHYPQNFCLLTVKATGGVLTFSYTPAMEGEHLIRVFRDDKPLCELVTYALEEDLYGLRPLKGDLHAHSYRSDGRCDPPFLATHYREQGYDFFSLTDHNRYYPGDEIDVAFDGVNTGLLRVVGEEVHATGCPIHIVNNGGRSSIIPLFGHAPENYEREVADIQATLPDTIPEQFCSRYARAKWVVDHIHATGGIATFAHPFWRPGASRTLNVVDEFAELLLMSGMFDAFEIVGGINSIAINRQVNFWADLRAKGLHIPVVGSSDVHRIGPDGPTFPNSFTVAFAADNTQDAVLDAVKNGLTVAVEATGNGYDRHYRPYGSTRLISYAQYLLCHYFPHRQRIIEGEGEMMRRYLTGECPKELIEQIAAQGEDYTLRFLGKKPPVLPSTEALAAEERLRDVQRNGPQHRTGDFTSDAVNYQI